MDDTSFMPTFGQSGGVIPELKIEDDDCYRDNVNLNCSIKTDPTAANYGGVQVEAYRQHSMEDVKPLPMEVEPDSEVSDSESLLGPQENDDSDLDGSYRPGSKSSKATRTRTRIHHKSNVLSALPRASRITKSRAPRTTGQQCKTCKQRFPPAAMGCHMTTEHNETRAYPCVFHWAGCDSVFGAKNEWKRHVQSQHLKLSFWRCTQGACGNSSRGYQGKKANADFNRKDLFTSHLRRMHLVGRIKQAQKDQKGVQAAWEQDSQMKAKVTRGQPCNNSVCPAEGCEQRFEGSKGWDDRMEHIAKHLEERKDVQLDQGAGGVREWALRQGLVAKEGDAWRLLDQSQSHVVSDADADVDAD